MYARVDFNVNNIPKSKNRKPKGTINKMREQYNAIKKATKIARIYNQNISYLNGKVGNYTGNKLNQKNINTLLRYSSYASEAIVSPYLAIASIAVDITNNLVDYGIRNLNSLEETNYHRSFLGNMATSNSRWRGNYK